MRFITQVAPTFDLFKRLSNLALWAAIGAMPKEGLSKSGNESHLLRFFTSTEGGILTLAKMTKKELHGIYAYPASVGGNACTGKLYAVCSMKNTQKEACKSISRGWSVRAYKAPKAVHMRTFLPNTFRPYTAPIMYRLTCSTQNERGNVLVLRRSPAVRPDTGVGTLQWHPRSHAGRQLGSIITR